VTKLSVQSYTWSDRDGEEIHFCSAQSSNSAAADIAVHGASSTRLAHRAVLALRLMERRNPNVAAVALANKNARIVWALLANEREFRSDYTPARAVA
jgi:transposase